MSEPATCTVPAGQSPSWRSGLLRLLGELFARAQHLGHEYEQRMREPEVLADELAAVLTTLNEVTAHLHRLGWDQADQPGEVKLEVNDALRRAVGGSHLRTGGGA